MNRSGEAVRGLTGVAVDPFVRMSGHEQPPTDVQCLSGDVFGSI